MPALPLAMGPRAKHSAWRPCSFPVCRGRVSGEAELIICIFVVYGGERNGKSSHLDGLADLLCSVSEAAAFG